MLLLNCLIRDIWVDVSPSPLVRKRSTAANTACNHCSRPFNKLDIVVSQPGVKDIACYVLLTLIQSLNSLQTNTDGARLFHKADNALANVG